MPGLPFPTSPAPPGSAAARRRDRFRRLLWRARFVVAACCCGLAAAVVAGELRPDPPPTVDVVVTARDVPAGTRLAAADLRVARVPAGLAPAVSYRSARSARGRTTSVALPAGTVVAPSLVAAGQLAGAAPDGTVVVALTLDAVGASVASPGTRVDLLAPSADGSSYLARRALVVGAPEHEPDAAGGSATLVVAVTPDEAEALAARPDGARVTAALVPSGTGS